MIQALYGLSTLIILWALAGGQIDLLNSRSPALGLGLVLMTLAARAYTKTIKESLLKVSDFKIAIPAGLVLTGLSFGFIALVKNTSFLGGDLSDWKNLSVSSIIFISFLAQPAAEIISRKFLQPAWGLSSVAFLDAVTVGFGAAHAIPFFIFWGTSYLLGRLAMKYTLGSALVARVLWSLLLLFGIKFL